MRASTAVKLGASPSALCRCVRTGWMFGAFVADGECGAVAAAWLQHVDQRGAAPTFPAAAMAADLQAARANAITQAAGMGDRVSFQVGGKHWASTLPGAGCPAAPAAPFLAPTSVRSFWGLPIHALCLPPALTCSSLLLSRVLLLHVARSPTQMRSTSPLAMESLTWCGAWRVASTCQVGGITIKM